MFSPGKLLLPSILPATSSYLGQIFKSVFVSSGNWLPLIHSVVYIGHAFSTFIASSNPELALFSEKAVFPGCVYKFFEETVKEKLHQMESNRQGRLLRLLQSGRLNSIQNTTEAAEDL